MFSGFVQPTQQQVQVPSKDVPPKREEPESEEEDFSDDDEDASQSASSTDGQDVSEATEEGEDMSSSEEDAESFGSGSGSDLSEEDVYLPEVLHDTLMSSSGNSIANIMEDIAKNLAEIVKLMSVKKTE